MILPTTHKETALKGCHDQIGHLGLEIILDLMCDHFIWPQMAGQVKEHVKKCHQCIIFKVKQQKAPRESIVITHVLELVHINYLYLEPGKGRQDNVLVVTDHFTWYTQVYITQSQMAQTGSIVGQFHCPLLTVGEDPFRPREEF